MYFSQNHKEIFLPILHFCWYSRPQGNSPVHLNAAVMYNMEQITNHSDSVMMDWHWADNFIIASFQCARSLLEITTWSSLIRSTYQIQLAVDLVGNETSISQKLFNYWISTSAVDHFRIIFSWIKEPNLKSIFLSNCSMQQKTLHFGIWSSLHNAHKNLTGLIPVSKGCKVLNVRALSICEKRTQSRSSLCPVSCSKQRESYQPHTKT